MFYLSDKSMMKNIIFLENETFFLFPRTPDEDFSILLEAAVMYDRRVAALLNEDDSTNEEFLWKEISDGKQYVYPRLLFIITGNNVSICMYICASVLTHTHTHISETSVLMQTRFDLRSIFHEGKGPEKEKYEEKIRRLHLKRVAFRTMWLSAEDYPLLLGRFFILCFFFSSFFPEAIKCQYICYIHRISRLGRMSAHFLFRVRPSNEGKLLSVSCYRIKPCRGL